MNTEEVVVGARIGYYSVLVLALPGWAHAMEKLGKYRIEAKIGQGAMGSVYKAWHPGFNDFVALKTIQDSRLGGGELLERFKVEGQALAKLKHQNIVQIYDADQADGIHFIVMEYMNGPGIDHIISKREDIPLIRRMSYLLPICHALDYAHKRRLFHRDIKPANIMLQNDGNEEIVKVVDFGIARLLDFSQTSTDLFIGAPAYMAPELLTASDRANEKTDIWALGVTMYELIAYQRPFEAPTLDEMKRSIVHGKPKPLSQFASDCPHDLEAVLDRMLAADPAKRYQVVEDILIDIEPVIKRMRSEAVATLVRRASEYYEIGDLDTAKITLNEAKCYDSSNTHIKQLMLKIQDELHRQELIPRLQGHLKRGREYLQSGSLREARGEAEAALGLDSKFEPAQRLLQEIEDTIARGQMVEQKIRLTRQRLGEGLLTQAEQIFTEVEGLDIANPQLRELKRQIIEERQKREKRKRLNQLLNQARGLLSSLDYEECLAAISMGLKEFPGEAELRKLQETARGELAELEKRRAKQRELGECRSLMAQEEFEGALQKLEQLSSLYADDSAIKNLHATAVEGAEQHKRRKRLEAGMAELGELLSAGDYKGVVSRGECLLQEFPKEREVQDLVNYAVTEVVQEELKQKQEHRENTIRELLKVGDFGSAASEASRAAEEYPGNLTFRALLSDAIRLRKKKEEQEELQLEAENRRLERLRREKEERHVADTRALIAKGDLSGATSLLDDIISQGILSELDERAILLRTDIDEKKRFLEVRSQQEQHRKEIEMQTIAAIRELLETGNFRAAMQILVRSVQEKTLSASNEQVRELQSEIEEKKKQAELRKQEEERRREEEERLVEAATALIDREEWDEATEVLQTIGAESITPTLGTRVEQLLREIQEKKKFKEFCQRVEQRRQEDQARRLEQIAGLLRKNDSVGAAQILSQAIGEGLLTPTEDRVKKLQGEIEERAHLAERQKREQRLKAGMEEQQKRELQEQKINEVKTLVDRGDIGSATQLLIDVTKNGILLPSDERVKRLNTEIEEGARREEIRREKEQKRKEAQERQIDAIRALFEKGDCVGAASLLDESVKSGILLASDERTKRFRIDIEQKIRADSTRKEEERKLFARELMQMTIDIRGAIGAREFSEAIRLADEFEWKHGHHVGISDLRSQAEQETDAEEEARGKRETALQQISGSLDAGDFGSAEILLNDNLKNGTLKEEDPRIIKLRAVMRELKSRQKEQKTRLAQRRRDGIDRARTLFKANSFDECLSSLSELQRDFPGDMEISDLARAAESGRNKRQLMDKIKALIDRRELVEARKELALLKKGYAQDAGVRTLQEFLLQSEESQRKKLHLEEKLASLQKAFEADKYEEVVRTGEILLRTYPLEPRLEELVNQSKSRLARQKEEKQKRELAQAAQVGAGSGPGTASAIGFPEQEEPPPATTVSEAPATHEEELATVERHLANFIGPLAILIVKKARTGSAEPQEQFNMLVSSLHAEADRQEFLAHRDEILHCLANLPSMKGVPLMSQTIIPSVARPGGKIDQETMAQASAQLARYLGPISRVLTERAACKADCLRTLYLILSEHLANQEERTRFLSDGGFSE